MKKIFISQPMAGKTYHEIIVDREEAMKEFAPEMETYEIIDSVAKEPSVNPLKALAYSINLMADADLVYFATGWQNARGCRIEHEIAVAYGKTILMGVGEGSGGKDDYVDACDGDCDKCADMERRMIEALEKMKELEKGIADMEDTLNDAYTLNDFCLNKVIRKQPMSECECIAESFSLKAMQNLGWLLGVLKE